MYPTNGTIPSISRWDVSRGGVKGHQWLRRSQQRNSSNMTFLQTSPKEECRPADIPFVVWYHPVQTMALLASC